MRTTICLNRRPGARHGALTVEFAMASVLAFMFFGAALEFAYVGSIRSALSNAAYEGARVGVTPGASSKEVKAEVKRILDTLSVRKPTIKVTPNNIKDDTPEVTVQIDVKMNQNGWISATWFKNRTLSRTITLRRERYGEYN